MMLKMMSGFVDFTCISAETVSLFTKRFNLSSSLLPINDDITLQIVCQYCVYIAMKKKWFSFSIWLLLQALHILSTPYHLPISL